MNNATEQNYKKITYAIEALLADNFDYLITVLDGLEALVANNNNSLTELEKIDLSLNILFSELIHRDFSKSYLYRLLYGIFVNTLVQGNNFVTHFASFRTRILSAAIRYEVIFRTDTTQKVYDSISAIQNATLRLADDINDIRLTGSRGAELSNFNVTATNRKFIRCVVSASDYLAALKKARSVLSEYLDVINLGLADEFLHIHQRALVVDTRSPGSADFQHNVNILDGSYRVEKDHYLEFTRKLPTILNSGDVQGETKEKIKSAIRYLRLGNQSTEVEHKFINYWIGLEYLFSNYESQNTINRIKEHFINAHLLAYLKRNTYSFKNDFGKISSANQALAPSFSAGDYSCLSEKTFFTDAGQHLLSTHPLIAYRALKLHKWFFPVGGGTANASDYLKKHKANLETHFTRIYRLRNEIIHDAATNTNNEHIVSNLRYYLTFILNELIDFFSRNSGKLISIEDYFVQNEIEIGNIEHSGYPLDQLLNVDCSIDFISG
ncbi:MAG: hypothetical protein IPI78_07635 [Chitinophagaceae bacterium]|nr:hypothetical protein [Chitinophagaceae bacterium]